MEADVPANPAPNTPTVPTFNRPHERYPAKPTGKQAHNSKHSLKYHSLEVDLMQHPRSDRVLQPEEWDRLVLVQHQEVSDHYTPRLVDPMSQLRMDWLLDPEQDPKRSPHPTRS